MRSFRTPSAVADPTEVLVAAVAVARIDRVQGRPVFLDAVYWYGLANWCGNVGHSWLDARLFVAVSELELSFGTRGATPRRRRAISKPRDLARAFSCGVQKHIMLLLPVTGMHGYVALAHAVSPSAATSRPAPPAAIRMVSTFERYNRFTKEMRETAQKLSRPGHGILATDESTPTVGRRLDTIGIENTEANRRVFREMLYTTPGLGDYISGVIMFDETLYQRTEGLGRRPGGVKFTKVLEEQGILPGIKVDTGLQRLAGTDGETATQGLDGLGERCKAYYAEGARFAKWRAVLKISPTEGMPSERAIAENAQALGRYASICQEHGLVPIVEPEVTLGPGDYSIERAAYETERVLSHVFRALNTHDVILECMLLKPSMVLPGLDATLAENDRDEVARLTVQTMMRTVPPAVPGIFFLSGGMGSEEATQNLQNLLHLQLQHAPVISGNRCAAVLYSW